MSSIALSVTIDSDRRMNLWMIPDNLCYSIHKHQGKLKKCRC